MISYSLICGSDHRFDAWMPSADACESQLEDRLVECPVCGSTDVAKALMAPAVRTSEKAESIRRIEAEWVGDRFAAEARAMETGQSDQRAVVGTATKDEIEELLDDGIDFTLLGPRPKAN